MDPIHSSVGFEVKHMVVSTFRGNFREFDALLETPEGTSRLIGHRRVRASVDVRDENLAAHLASPGVLRRRAISRDPLRVDRHPGGR